MGIPNGKIVMILAFCSSLLSSCKLASKSFVTSLSTPNDFTPSLSIIRDGHIMLMNLLMTHKDRLVKHHLLPVQFDVMRLLISCCSLPLQPFHLPLFQLRNYMS